MTGKKQVVASAHDRALVDSFLDMMSAERGASANTLDAYRRDILDFAASCARSRTTLKEAARNHVRSFLESLGASGLKSSSQARKLSALRRFYAFLYGEGIRRDDPCGAVEGPRLSRPLPKILSETDALKLVEAARGEEPDDAESARLLCIVEMLYASGLRISELVTLPVASVRANERFLHVRGKGGRERLAPLGAAASEALQSYLNLRDAFLPRDAKRLAASSRFLFPSRGQEGYLTRRRCHQLAEGARPEGRARSLAPLAACAASCVCDASGRRRRGLAQRADASRPRRHCDDSDIHPCGGRSAEADRRGGAPACTQPGEKPELTDSGQTDGRMKVFLDFEKPIAELEGKIEELRQLGRGARRRNEVGGHQHRRRGRAPSGQGRADAASIPMRA